jgi:hypothetical protein
MTEKEVALRNAEDQRIPWHASVMIVFVLAVGVFFPASLTGPFSAAKADTPGWLSGHNPYRS